MGKWQKKILNTHGQEPTKPVLRVLKVPDPSVSQKKNALELDGQPHRLWLVSHPDGRVVSHSFGPPATADQVQAWYPDAKAIEPEDSREHEPPAGGKPQYPPRSSKLWHRRGMHPRWKIEPKDAQAFDRDFGYPVTEAHVRNIYPTARVICDPGAVEDAAVTEQEASQ